MARTRTRPMPTSLSQRPPHAPHPHGEPRLRCSERPTGPGVRGTAAAARAPPAAGASRFRIWQAFERHPSQKRGCHYWTATPSGGPLLGERVTRVQEPVRVVRTLYGCRRARWAHGTQRGVGSCECRLCAVRILLPYCLIEPAREPVRPRVDTGSSSWFQLPAARAATVPRG
jgi:hypothetical protein